VRPSCRQLCALFLAVSIFVCGVAASAASAQVVAGPAESLSGGLTVEGADLLMKGQWEAAARARLANPEAAVARAASARAYSSLTSRDAEKLAGELFPRLIAEPNGGVPRLSNRQRVTGFAGRFTAHVDRGGGRRGVIDSTRPMATMSSSGAWTPIDLSLRDVRGGFAGAKPLVAARLPKRLAEGAQLTSVGLSVTPVDAHGTPLKGSPGRLAGASDFVANTMPDSDTVLKLSTYGFSIDTLLRSDSSPKQLSFRVGLPSGAHLGAAADEDGGVRVVKDGVTVASMPAPTASDAAGVHVPVSVHVSGHQVDLTVARGHGEYLYPIAVDPEFNTTSEKTKTNSRTWPFTHEGNSAAGYLGEEMWINQGNGAAGQWGALNYVTNGNSKIYEFNATTSVEPTQGNGTEYWVTSGESYVEIAGPSGSETRVVIAEPFVHLTESPKKTKACPWSNCTPESGAGGNTVRFVLRATSPYAGPQLRVKSATVAISQPKETHSTVSYNKASSEIEYTSGGKVVKTPNVLYGAGGWLGPSSGALEFSSEDAGLGVSGTKADVLNGGTWWQEVTHNYLESEACNGVQCAKTQKEVLTYAMLHSRGYLVNGSDTIRVAAHDPMSATWSYEHGEGEATVKVDNAAPHGIALTGLTSKAGVYELDETVAHAKIEATDGEGSTPSSGIKSITFSVDGKEVGSAAGSCAPGPCTGSREWAVNGGELGAGSHALTVVATDNAGNVASKEFALNVYHASPAALGAGSVNPQSGDFALEAADVNMSGGDGALTVTRSYSSRDLQAGAEGPLGPQWTISLGSLASLEVLPDNSVMILGPEGFTHFSNKAGGGFEAPVGDTGLKLETETTAGKITAYLLKNATSGTTTKFTLPSGAETWMPTVSEGPIATNTTTDEYTTAEPEAGKKIVEPILEVAPHPSATCTPKKLEKGCRALEFNYAASTTATGEGESGWGDYKGNLTRVYFIAWDPASKEMKTTTVAQYSYDTHGRLRAEWDPRISPALKTIYGYDAEGHVTALTRPGGETTAFVYGMISGDATSGRLMKTAGAPASAPLWSGSAPSNTAAPTVTPEPMQIGVSASATAGTWSGSPVAYRYQWQRCNASGAECTAIAGANNEAYKPALLDAGHELKIEVQAINGGGSTAAYSAATKVQAPGPLYTSKFGSYGSGNGQLNYANGVATDSSGNVWVADTSNHRVQEFSSTGTFIKKFGTEGTGNGQFKYPWGVTVTSSGNVWVTDTANARVEEFNGSGEFIRRTAVGQLVEPWGIGTCPSTNFWVADIRGNRIKEYNALGVLLREAGTAGSGNGQLNEPTGITCDSANNVWVDDAGNNRVQEFSSTGVYTKQFGSAGGGAGQFNAPLGIAIDSAGTVWVTDSHNRVQGFNSDGVYITQSGSGGAGNGQFNSPSGVAIAPSGAMYITDTANQRVQEFGFSLPTLTFTSKFASGGSEAGQLSWPGNLALDSSGNVWVADCLNNRVQEFTPAGSYVRQFGTAGSGNGQLNTPGGVGFAADGNVWVVDTGNNRVQEFEPDGKYIRQFGASGSGTGQFNSPHGILVAAGTGNLWISDTGNSRLEEFEPDGKYIRQVTAGSGNGQFNSPGDMAADAEGHIWVDDSGNNRVQELSSTGEYIRQFGSFGGGHGQFYNPSGIAIDGAGDIWVADTFNDRIQGFTPGGEFVTEYGAWGEGNGQFYDPNAIAVSKTGAYYVLDAGWGRVQQLAMPAGASEPTAAPHTEGAAVTTVEYNVPVSGSGAPYAMGSSDIAKWAQTDTPTVATAFFPPDEPVGWPAENYTRARVYYMDSHARTVNVAAPGGAIATTEYNTYNDVTRSLSVANRAAALEHGASSAEFSKLVDTQNIYTTEGSRLTETLGPQHTVKIAKGNEHVPSGSEVLARSRVKDYYNEGAPATGETYNLVTKTTSGAENASKEEFDVRTTTMSYSGQSNLGWKLRLPTSTTTDPAGLKITHTTVYDETSGEVVETRGPASTGSGDPHDTVAVFYTAAANSTYPACGGHIEWSGLPCQMLPGKQPETSGLPPLPVTTTTYNLWDQPETVTEAFGSTTRTRKTTYDSAGRPQTSEVTSTNGTAVPSVTNHYDEKTGALVKKSEVFEGTEKTITMKYNSVGELETYTDADKGATTYKYDIDGRPTEMTMREGGLLSRGTQTYTYDSTTGLLTSLADSHAGTFTAAYDAAGRMTSESYPNKMNATYGFNSVGQATGLEYTKTAHCASTCPESWFKETTVPSVHGETLKQSSTLAEKPKEVYDEAGRLLEVQEIPTGQGCKTRIYAYDVESNRTGLTTVPPGGEGKCATEGGSAEAHTYDSANRLTDSGVTYETFGNVTSLPAADAGGTGMEITSSYYVDNQVASQTQNGKTTNYYMDPAGRLREARAPGVSVTHYAGPSSTTSWVSEPESKWSRNIRGIDGSLSAIRAGTGTVTLQLHDLQGNIVGTAALSEAETKLLSTYSSTEFGVPVNGTPPKYAWLGADGLASESASGVVVKNGVTYIPQTGRPMQTQSLKLPNPSNAASPYAAILAPWVVEGTAAVAKQLTTAEEAKKAAEEAARLAEQQQWERPWIGGAGGEEEGPESEGATASGSRPNCEIKWKMGEFPTNGGVMYESGGFHCEHHVANFELRVCMWAQLPKEKYWTEIYCAGPGGSLVFHDSDLEELMIKHWCQAGLLYTGTIWGHEWAPGHKSKGTYFAKNKDKPYSPGHPNIECRGDAGTVVEEWEAL
jgi:YD repeat-containing protein